MPSKEFEELLAEMQEGSFYEISSVDEMRANLDAGSAQFPKDDDASFEPVSEGGVEGEWVTAGEFDTARVVLYIHGGGYVVGSPGSHRTITSEIAGRAHCRVLAVRYRLAPEHTFPAALDDTIAAYEHLLSTGTDAANIAIAGDSAGGGLALATLLKAKAKTLPMPSCAILICPWVDMTLQAETIETKVDVDPCVKLEALQLMSDYYLAGHDRSDPLVSPLFGDLSGLPPLLIQTGTNEILMDDSVRLDNRARSVGVVSTLTCYEAMIHVFHLFSFRLPEAKQALQEITEFAQCHWKADDC